GGAAAAPGPRRVLHHPGQSADSHRPVPGGGPRSDLRPAAQGLPAWRASRRAGAAQATAHSLFTCQPSVDMSPMQQFTATLRNGRIGIPVVVLSILAMIILPLPPLVLDILFTFNIGMAVLVLLVCVSTRTPLDFSLLPTVIL